jgi:hypothetical protein
MSTPLAEVLIENWADLWEARSGRRLPEGVRRIVVPDARIDTRIASIALPTPLIQQLGLAKLSRACATDRTWKDAPRYWPVQLTLLGRQCLLDVFEVPADAPVRVGLAALTALDLVVDVAQGRVTTNPAHGGEHILELY